MNDLKLLNKSQCFLSSYDLAMYDLYIYNERVYTTENSDNNQKIDSFSILILNTRIKGILNIKNDPQYCIHLSLESKQ